MLTSIASITTIVARDSTNLTKNLLNKRDYYQNLRATAITRATTKHTHTYINLYKHTCKHTHANTH